MSSGKKNKSKQQTMRQASSISPDFSTINTSDLQASVDDANVITHGGGPSLPAELIGMTQEQFDGMSPEDQMRVQEVLMAHQMQLQANESMVLEQQNISLMQQHMEQLGNQQPAHFNGSIQMVQSEMLNSSLMQNPDQSYGTLNFSNAEEGHHSKDHQQQQLFGFKTPQQQMNLNEHAMSTTQIGTHAMNSPSMQQHSNFNGFQHQQSFASQGFSNSSKKRPSQMDSSRQSQRHYEHIDEDAEEDKSDEEADQIVELLPQKRQVDQRQLGNASKQSSRVGSFRDGDPRQDYAYARMGGVGGLPQGRGQPGQKVTVTRSQLSGVMKSKLDIYNILTKEGQMYMPPFSDCPMDFIREVLMGKKKAFKNSDIKLISVPNFEELSAKNVFEQVKSSRPDMRLYLPDVDHLTRPLNREYMFNVINTVDESFFIENIRHGYELRKIRHSDKNQTQMEMDANLFQLLMSSNQIVHNRGRALAYLGNAEKKRKGGSGLDGQKLVRHQFKRKQELSAGFQGIGGGVQLITATQAQQFMHGGGASSNNNSVNISSFKQQ